MVHAILGEGGAVPLLSHPSRLLSANGPVAGLLWGKGEAVRRTVKFEQPSESEGNPRALGMSKLRFLFANGVIGVLIICSLLALAIDAEPWPFSNYPMFSYLAGDTGNDYSFTKEQFYGVLQEEPHQQFPLRGSYIEPFQEDRLISYVQRIENGANYQLKTDPAKRQQLLNDATRDLFVQYETLRQAGRHDGPPLQGIRLYHLYWQLDPRAENVDQPDHWELLAEYEPG